MSRQRPAPPAPPMCWVRMARAIAFALGVLCVVATSRAGPVPQLSVSDTSTLAGNVASFTISLSSMADGFIQLQCVTTDLTAMAGIDYEGPDDPEIFFFEGETTKVLDVITFDSMSTVDLIFALSCSDIVGSVFLADNQGIGTISIAMPSAPPVPSASPSPSLSPSASPTVSPSPTVSASPSATVSASPSASPSPSPGGSVSPSPSPPPVVAGSDHRIFMYFAHTFTYNLPRPPMSTVDVTFFDDLRMLAGVELFSGLPNSGSFSWAPHHVFPTSQGRIRVQLSTDPSEFDDLFVTLEI
eukprot:TRINITY_DN6683_c1_g1_i1.p1 TRINITY_DN6683_c1_g1~~TRINITY_DN6683_c1_g1_i1.p1  ORF type:complete len:317 (-),score=37.48 TRINITY_DN6683_c1_g1_i1:485-1381(-)